MSVTAFSTLCVVAFLNSNFMNLLLLNAYKTLFRGSGLVLVLKLEAEALVLKVQAICVLKKKNNFIEI